VQQFSNLVEIVEAQGLIPPENVKVPRSAAYNGRTEPESSTKSFMDEEIFFGRIFSDVPSERPRLYTDLGRNSGIAGLRQRVYGAATPRDRAGAKRAR
jgi:hypothetical protein